MSLRATTLWPLSKQTDTHKTRTLFHVNSLVRASCSLDLPSKAVPQMRCHLLLNSPVLIWPKQLWFMRDCPLLKLKGLNSLSLFCVHMYRFDVVISAPPTACLKQHEIGQGVLFGGYSRPVIVSIWSRCCEYGLDSTLIAQDFSKNWNHVVYLPLTFYRHRHVEECWKAGYMEAINENRLDCVNAVRTKDIYISAVTLFLQLVILK